MQFEVTGLTAFPIGISGPTETDETPTDDVVQEDNAPVLDDIPFRFDAHGAMGRRIDSSWGWTH